MQIATSSRRHLFSRGAFAALASLSLAAPARADSSAHGEPIPSSPADLAPPKITVLHADSGASRGFVFVAPKAGADVTTPEGPEIIDDAGRPVWFHALPPGDQAADFRVQHYRGEPVLTWTQGRGLGGVPITPTVDYIVDRSYRVIATVRAGNGLNADQHEFKLTKHDTALIVVYDPVPFDLSPFGGPSGAQVVDGIVQEIDVASGRVLFEWHSLGHVDITESKVAVPATATATAPYDYFHINAVSVDEDHNLLVSARNTWTIYKIDHRDGHVIWRLGGTKSDFVLGPGVAFAWQHDPEPVDAHTFRLFDNEAAPGVLPHSRVITISHDLASHTATLVRSIEHPDGLLAPSQGNSQALENGDTFVGWGALGRVSEFDSDGTLVFDASVPAGYDNYRAYRSAWLGKPDTAPTVTATTNGDGTATVHAIWNGATRVARWVVVGGHRGRALFPIASAAWNGLDTAIPVSDRARLVAVVAEDGEGRVLGRSESIAVGH
jgi:hypothetical protein